MMTLQSKSRLLASLLVLVLTGCGGETDDTGGSQSGAEQDNPMNPANPAETGSDDGDPSDTPEEPGMSTPPTPADPGNPGAEPEAAASNEPDPIGVPINPIDPDPPEPSEPPPAGTEEPGPVNPVDPCANLSCGDVCDPNAGFAALLAAPPAGDVAIAYCDAAGQCSYSFPTCEGSGGDCTSMCPVTDLCMLCDDGSCATATVACNPDGSCGATTRTCPEDNTEPNPDPAECPAFCAVPALCQLCDDGSCAATNVGCNEDGSCGEITYTCAGDEPMPDGCSADTDCPATRIACAACEDGSSACPSYGCVDGQCVLAVPGCEGEYDPCAGKAEGDTCSLCAPDDTDCFETGEIKVCQGGECLSDTSGGEAQ
jgi:hypothetical protein